uniref:non-specific serine/threonine protein kinase n=1 Tax=Rhizophora mucronata TaxID=61149 RepID=A0A2P2LPT6_RHIMU
MYSKVKIECPILIMAIRPLSLLLLVQFLSILAYGFEIQSIICGADHITYAKVHGDELLYINGNLVDRDSFCKAIQFYHADDCVFEDFSTNSYCGLDLSRANLALKQGRKLLQNKVREEPTVHYNGHNVPAEEKKNDSLTISNPKKVGILATAIVAMCCGFLCPCFYAKRKAADRSVVAKDPNSMDSVSSHGLGSPSGKVPSSPFRVSLSPSRFSNSPKLSRLGSVHLTLSQVSKATGNFSPSLRIGEGGFGTVYKAELDGGQVVAIKRAKKEHFESLQNEFSSEVELLAKIDHRNLVKLLGYIDRGNERLIITEYVPNGTLREHLDGQRGKILDFNQRLEISIDVAHALTYLHLYSEKQIIHRDVKSSNILLTESMRAKVADFGFARLGAVDSDQTHVSTKVKGTVGYLDPEYMRTNQLTTKSDVFSFGILLIEILTGRRPVEMRKPAQEKVTLRWVFRMYNEGTALQMVDPLMEEVIDVDVLMKMFTLAIQCAAPVRSDRPDMKVVGEQLWAIRVDYLKSAKRG